MKGLRRFLLVSALVVVVLGTGATLVHADGIIIPDPPPDNSLPEIPYLTVRYHHVDVSIDGAIATTRVDQVFVNETRRTIEGTYIFPVPLGATITDFAMTVDGKRLLGEILEREEARRIYEEIVRRQRDPALLEYIGRGMFKARIFPIPAGEERRVEIEYTQVLQPDNGLYHYLYPLDTERFSARPLEQVSIGIDIRSETPLRAVYSPSHDVVVSREGDYRARVGYEETGTLPARSFELYFSTTHERFGVSVLSYKPAGEDGFFLLLAAPEAVKRPGEVIARDIVFVLDTSGSMMGDKIVQARAALVYALKNLNPQDRFNVVDFSTGVRSFADRLVPAEQAPQAIQYVEEREARGGTDINRAMLEALSYFSDSERPQVIIFLTDGLPTEGVTKMEQIIANVAQAAGAETRIFTFGVGYDVNTILLDTIAEQHRGASVYILPGESIEERVSAFYAKVSTPLLTNPHLDFGGVHVEETYPYPLPDFFLGSQLVLAGRYREGGSTTITLSGEVHAELQDYVYENVRFARTGGDPFVARLWATRKIGHLLTQIRLHGEDRELIDALVDLSIRYGVVTPYTSFLVLEDDVLTEGGRQEIVERELRAMQTEPAAASGEAAVQKSVVAQELRGADIVVEPRSQEVRIVGDKAFVLRQGVWVDTQYDPDGMQAQQIPFGSSTYFQLLTDHANAGPYLSIGKDVILILDGIAFQVTHDGDPISSESDESNENGNKNDHERDPLAELMSLYEKWWRMLRQIFGQ